MRDDFGAVSNLTLEQYKDAYLAFLPAFNRQDLARAFTALTPTASFGQSKSARWTGTGRA
jgi:hypothetical protein